MLTFVIGYSLRDFTPVTDEPRVTFTATEPGPSPATAVPAEQHAFASTLTKVMITEATRRQVHVNLPDSTHIAAGTRDWLISVYPEVNSPGRDRQRIRWVGFGVQRFLRTLVADCARQGTTSVLPHTYWGDCDVIELYDWTGGTDPAAALRTINGLPAAEAVKWREWLRAWKGPGYRPELDMHLAYHLAAFLGVV